MRNTSAFLLLLLIGPMVNWKILNTEHLTRVVELDEKVYGKVIHVSALFRHGDRSPSFSYPRDPHSHYPWPDGMVQLTKAGKRRMYEVGKWFRKRYFELIQKVNSHTTITVTSSDKDRAIMSAQCFMAGFYQPNKTQRITKWLRWQPVPIRTIPLSQDNLIGNTKECPVWMQLFQKTYKGEKLKKVYDKYNKTFAYIQKNSGLNFTRNDLIPTYINVWRLHDLLKVQEENDLVLPKWTKKIFPEPLLTIRNAFDYRELVHRKARKLSAGPLLNSIKEAMVKKVEKNSTQIFNFYSGHEAIITYLSTILGFGSNKTPPYGSSLIFELRRKQNDHIVTLFYANSTNAAPYLMKIPKCETVCSLGNFVRATRHLIPKNWETECQLKNTTNYDIENISPLRYDTHF